MTHPLVPAVIKGITFNSLTMLKLFKCGLLHHILRLIYIYAENASKNRYVSVKGKTVHCSCPELEYQCHLTCIFSKLPFDAFKCLQPLPATPNNGILLFRIL